MNANAYSAELAAAMEAGFVKKLLHRGALPQPCRRLHGVPSRELPA
jgi:hypothetical protein